MENFLIPHMYFFRMTIERDVVNLGMSPFRGGKNPYKTRAGRVKDMVVRDFRG